VAPDAPETVSVAPADGPSPWWYRWRFLTIGAVYFCGFFFGNLVTGILGLPVVPAVVQWGAALGPNGTRILYGVAFLFALVAWALRTWGGAYLRPDVVWNADALGDRLLVDGPFSYVRNPLYLGNLFLALAAGLLAPPPASNHGCSAHATARRTMRTRPQCRRYSRVRLRRRSRVRCAEPRRSPSGCAPRSSPRSSRCRCSWLGYTLSLVPEVSRSPLWSSPQLPILLCSVLVTIFVCLNFPYME